MKYSTRALVLVLAFTPIGWTAVTGCQVDPISMGGDDPTECRESDCNAVMNVLCDDGSVRDKSCERQSDGRCDWKLAKCPSVVDPETSGGSMQCTSTECGSRPATANRLCPDGTMAGASCRRDAEGACSWRVTECSRADCNPMQCGRLPSEDPMCPDGSTGSFACESDATGGCAWAPRCAPVRACTAMDCGSPPETPTMCPGGAYVCEPDPFEDGSCVWTEDCATTPPCDCDDPPSQQPMCAAGGFGSWRCQVSEMGPQISCGWVADCPPPPTCSAMDCGMQPSYQPMCVGNFWGTWECQNAETGCQWTPNCQNPCDTMVRDDCGPPPTEPAQCGEDVLGGWTCQPDLTGSCQWTATCAELVCDATSCGAAPDVMCPGGSTALVCALDATGVCGWRCQDAM